MEGINTLFPALEARGKDKAVALAKLVRQRPGNPVVALGLVLLGLPLYLAVTLPLGLLATLHRLFFFAGRKQARDDVSTEEVERITKQHASFPTPAERPYDIVVMGATGLTGGVLARYLASYHKDVRVALAGRTKAKVEAVRAKLGPDAAGFGIIVADSSDLASLFALCHQTRVVATTVGPFKRFGTRLVHACAHSGTHYADITGESDWVAHMTRLYNEDAQRTGAAILSCCGVDSVPSDVGSFLAARALRDKHGEQTTVSTIEAVMTKFSGGAPAGTIETMAGVVDGTDKLQKAPRGFSAAEKAHRKGATKFVGMNNPLARSGAFKQWTIPFFMAQTNSHTVRRTNALLGYIPSLTYTERWGFPDFSAAVVMLTGFVMALPYIGLPLLRGLARSGGALPNASAGARATNASTCAKGSCCMLVSASGTTADGLAVSHQLIFAGLGDVGVAHTAVCQGEIAVLLAKRKVGASALVGAGLTPVSALGTALPDALLKTGFVYIEDAPDNVLRK